MEFGEQEMIAEILSAVGVGAALSARWNWWRPKTKGLRVLMYHKIGVPPKKSNLRKLWVSPKQFAKQIDYLNKHGYTTLLFSELAQIYNGNMKMPKKPVLITFDDGYKNNYTEAFRILKEKRAKGNIFLVYNSIGGYNHWHDPIGEPWINMLTWEQVKEMDESGLMDFGSHTMNHPNLPAIELNTVSWEARESKKRIEEKLGREITAFAYPYGAGAFVPEVRKRVLEAGYLFDFSIKQGIAPWHWNREKMALKRLFIRGDDYMLDFYLNLTRGKARF